jgi:hypothetical protein
MEIFSLFIRLVYVLALVVLFFIFYKAVKVPGLQRLNKTTFILLIVITVLFILPFIGNIFFPIPNLAPYLVIYSFSKPLMLTVALGLLLFSVVYIIKTSKVENVHLLKAVWIVIIVVNSIDAVRLILQFISLMPLFTMSNTSFSQQGWLRPLFILLIFNTLFTTPLFWVIISWMNLRKINKEKKLSLLNEEILS